MEAHADAGHTCVPSTEMGARSCSLFIIAPQTRASTRACVNGGARAPMYSDLTDSYVIRDLSSSDFRFCKNGLNLNEKRLLFHLPCNQEPVGESPGLSKLCPYM